MRSIDVCLCLYLSAVIILAKSATSTFTQHGTAQSASGVGARQCQEGFFQCGNSSQCLAQMYWCDDLIHCDNGQDESFSVCHFTGGFLESFSGNHVPLRAADQDQVDDICVLPYYPSRCTCMYNDRLNCQTLGLQELPQPLSSNITIAMFQQNKIQMKSGMFRDLELYFLRYLYLEENSILEIPDGSFDGLGNLYHLNLADNRLNRLHSGMFHGLNNLRWLNLVGNLISEIEEGTWTDTPGLVWLRLDFNRLDFDEDAVLDLPSDLLWLHLEGNSISTTGANLFSKAANLQNLILKNNDIDKVSKDAFSHLRYLGSLDMSFNKITDLPSDVFFNNTLMDDLSIGNNPMDTLPVGLFQNLNNISRLDLAGLTINNIHQSMFDHLRDLNFIKLNTFQYCRYAKYVRACSPKGDGLSDFNDLLSSNVLRVLIWVVAIVTVSGNVTVVISRLIIREQHRAHSMFLRNLSASDLLMGIYLIIIGAQDVRMRHIFNQEALDWMSSRGCQMTGVLSMVSCEVSVLLLAFMTAERFMAVVYPLRKTQLTFAKSLMWVSMAWIAGLVLSVFPLFLDQSIGNFYGSNGVCFPLHIHEPYRRGWQYSAFLFLGINLLAFFTIAVLYGVMLMSIVKTRQQAVGHSHRLDLVVVRRFTLIVMTDALCWIPIAVIKICALCHVTMSDNVHSWLTVLVVPVNSALNPMIYSLSTPYFCIKLKESFKSHSQTSQSSQSYRPFHRDANAIQPLTPPRREVTATSLDAPTEEYHMVPNSIA